MARSHDNVAELILFRVWCIKQVSCHTATFDASLVTLKKPAKPSALRWSVIMRLVALPQLGLEMVETGAPERRPLTVHRDNVKGGRVEGQSNYRVKRMESSRVP